jgi:hypothetical protein
MPETLREQVIEIVRNKLGDPAAEVDAQTDESEQAIKNYCNITAVPDGLKYTWANMTVDLVRHDRAKDTGSGEGADAGIVLGGAVASIKEGDTTVSFGADAGKKAEERHLAEFDDIVFGYRSQMNMFRVIRGYGHGTT